MSAAAAASTAARVVRGSRFRRVWLLLSIASTAALTDAFVVRCSRRMECEFVGVACIAAWTALLLAGGQVRREFPNLRPGRSMATFVAMFFTIACLRSAFFPLAPLPEIARYYALVAAVQADDLRSVEQILRTDRAPDFTPGSASGGPSRRQWVGSPEVDYIPRPLQLAVSEGAADIADALIRHGASAVAPGLLNEAARGNDVPMLRLLVAHGASVNDGKGNSLALYLAVSGDSPQAVAFLLSQGANPDSRISDGPLTPTALSHARNLGDGIVVRLLQQAGATE